MLRRVGELTGSQNVHRTWGGTFHRIANIMLRRHGSVLGYDANYSILDTGDSCEFINVCIDELAIDTTKKRFPKAEVLQSIISFANNTDTPIDDVIVAQYPYFHTVADHVKRVEMVYRTRKQERNVMDYDDLLLNAKRLLVEHKDVHDLYAEQFQHILVDEYQDTNKLQAELIDLLALCAAMTVNALPGAGAAGSAYAIAAALGLDMADWWEPTAEAYLNHVPKAQIIAALKEAGPELAGGGVEAMKKDALVTAAASRLAGTRWLPEPLRRSPG